MGPDPKARAPGPDGDRESAEAAKRPIRRQKRERPHPPRSDRAVDVARAPGAGREPAPVAGMLPS